MNRITLFCIFNTSCAEEYQKVDLEIQRFIYRFIEINKKIRKSKFRLLKINMVLFSDVFESQI